MGKAVVLNILLNLNVIHTKGAREKKRKKEREINSLHWKRKIQDNHEPKRQTDYNNPESRQPTDGNASALDGVCCKVRLRG